MRAAPDIFNNPVRFVGDPVAAVAAVNRHVAEEALLHIVVDYEVLPFVLEPEEALAPGAVKIWPEGNLALNARNEAQPNVQTRGNVTAALASADRTFDDRYTTAFEHNAQMEPRVAVASWRATS
jgi:CO/xanthine dehydrogenase Mo-binding subunit